MPRKKREKVEEIIKGKSDDRFIYCHHLKCPHTECLRHNVNAPFNVILYFRKFNPDKDWNCKDLLL